MVNGKKVVVIVDISTDVDENCDRNPIVSRGKKLIAKVDLVGVQTLQLGQAQNVKLSYAIDIPRLQFDNEKYCYIDDQLYEISTITKAKEPTHLLLNVAKIENFEIANAIKNWLEAENDNI